MRLSSSVFPMVLAVLLSLSCLFSIVAADESVSVRSGTKLECDHCTSPSECAQGKCWGRPKKCTDGSMASLLRCEFKPACEPCTTKFECATKKCSGGLCVPRRAPADVCMKKGECELCSDASECQQGKCWGKPKKCTDGKLDSLLRCFLGECEACTSNFECATKKCWNGKCVFKTQASRDKCFPPLKEECELCKEDEECEQGKCWGKPRKCTDGSFASLSKCFAGECDSCASDFECATKKCWNRKCVFDTQESRDKCFPPLKPECALCREDEECEQGKCWGKPRKCTDGSFESLSNCFAGECDSCISDFECATKKCWNRKCVFDTQESRDMCFPPLKPECALCKEDDECEQGKCWGKPRKCTDGSLPSRERCFLGECEDCTSKFECASKKCWKKKCVFNTLESREKCFPMII